MIKLSNRFTDKLLKGSRASLTIFSFGIPVVEITATMYHVYFSGSDKGYYQAAQRMVDIHFRRSQRLRVKYYNTPLSIYKKARV